MPLLGIEVDPTSARSVLFKIEHAQSGLQSGLSSGLEAAAIYLASYIKGQLLSGQLVNNRTGNLRRAVFQTMLGPLTALVGVGREAPYARFVNDGTQPHEIVARKAKALHFFVGGQEFFRKRVHHPGITARKFMETGLQDSLSEIRRIVLQHVVEAAQLRSAGSE